MVKRRLVPPPDSPGNAGPSRLPAPDDPIPSIEHDRPGAGETGSARSPAPSISINTLGDDDSESRFPDPSFSTPASLYPEQGDVGSVSDRLQELRLCTSVSPSPSSGRFDLDNLRAALPGARTPSPRRTLGLLPDGSLGSSARRRRRSASANQGYDVGEEAPPQDRFYNPEFQRSFTHAKSLMTRLARVLGSSTLPLEPDSTMKALHDKAGELAHFRCPPTRTVGFVGDSGVGKSSLLNSLLDFRNLAKTSNGGSACTCVVTEYRHHDRADFAIEVVLFTENELKKQLRKMVMDYRDHYLHADEMEFEDDRRHSADRANLACDTLTAMFADRFPMNLLQTNRPEKSVVRRLVEWAVDVRRDLGIDEHTTEESLEGCSELLKNLTSNRGAVLGGQAAWPYIKKISVSLNARILSKGLVVVDLPGLRDINMARRMITERYLLHCDEIFAVCPIGRATTDEGVEAVFELARRARLSNVSIICTKSDDIRAEEAQGDLEGAQSREMSRFNAFLATAELERVALEEQIDDFRDLEDIMLEEEIKKARLHDERDDKIHEIENLKFERQRYMIITRNALVESRLRGVYGSAIRGANLRVFCASNSLYWEHRNARSRATASKFLELSGIVTIRKHCMGLVSESQLRIATKYLRDDIPNLLSNVELWVQSGAGTADAERKRAAREALDAFGGHLRTTLVGDASPLNNMARALENAFGEDVYQRRRIRRWTEGAIQVGQVWSGWHHSSYAAFCRHYGTHNTRAAGNHCWNEEAMKTMNDDLADPWDRFQSSADEKLDDAIRFVPETLDRAIIRHLANALQGFPGSVRPLKTALMSHKRSLAAVLEDSGAKFSADLSKLGTDALSGLRTSYFGQSMESTYSNAIREYGTGSTVKKIAIINRALGDEQLLKDLMRKFKRKFGELATQLEADLLSLVDEHLDAIDNTLDMVRSENVALESERNPVFRARVGDEISDLKEEMDRVLATVGNA